MEIRMARTDGGYGVAYSLNTVDTTEALAIILARLDEEGATVAGPTPIAEGAGSGAVWHLSLAPRGDGFAVARWIDDSVVLDARSPDGTSAAAPVTIGSGRGRWRDAPVIRSSGAGYVVGWSDGIGVRVARTDASGVVSSVIDVAPGLLRDVVVEDDGTVALLWTAITGCAHGHFHGEEMVLTRLGADGARLHPDVLVHRDTTGNRFGGALAATGGGLRASYATYAPSVSTAWIVPACVP
jgi:hypothetical protein